MTTKIDPRYMIATTAIHTMGDISRPKGDLCVVCEEDDEAYIGNWISGFGFINVRFPKDTTRELNPEEVEKYHGMGFQIGSNPPFQIDIKGTNKIEVDESKMQHAHLEDWSLSTVVGAYQAPEQGSPVLLGTVSGHPRLADGTEIQTSRISTFDMEAKKAITMNTVYTLGQPLKAYAKWLAEHNAADAKT